MTAEPEVDSLNKQIDAGRVVPAKPNGISNSSQPGREQPASGAAANASAAKADRSGSGLHAPIDGINVDVRVVPRDRQCQQPFTLISGST